MASGHCRRSGGARDAIRMSVEDLFAMCGCASLRHGRCGNQKVSGLGVPIAAIIQSSEPQLEPENMKEAVVTTTERAKSCYSFLGLQAQSVISCV